MDGQIIDSYLSISTIHSLLLHLTHLQSFPLLIFFSRFLGVCFLFLFSSPPLSSTCYALLKVVACPLFPRSNLDFPSSSCLRYLELHFVCCSDILAPTPSSLFSSSSWFPFLFQILFVFSTTFFTTRFYSFRCVVLLSPFLFSFIPFFLILCIPLLPLCLPPLPLRHLQQQT